MGLYITFRTSRKSPTKTSTCLRCNIHLVEIAFSRNIAFFAGSMLAVMLALSFYDQDVLTAEHAISFMASLGKNLRSQIFFKRDYQNLFHLNIYQG